MFLFVKKRDFLQVFGVMFRSDFDAKSYHFCLHNNVVYVFVNEKKQAQKFKARSYKSSLSY
jgi:hypothetical protein